MMSLNQNFFLSTNILINAVFKMLSSILTHKANAILCENRTFSSSSFEISEIFSSRQNLNIL